jgi:CheY-like chemotaxis protein
MPTQPLPTPDEQARIASLERLLAERDELVRALEAKLTSLEQAGEAADLAKREFLARMSHEVRTPLNAIIGLGDLTLKTQLNAKQRDYLVKMLFAARSLLSLVSDLLDYSRIEAGGFELLQTPFRLGDLLDRILDRFAPVASRKGVALSAKLERDAPNELVGDPLRLSQTLSHLTDNALKFTTQGGVRITASLANATSSQASIRFSVKDTGQGVAPETLQALFEPFAQADESLTRVTGGAGIGLTLSKRLVELMGGKLAASSRPGEGSEFFFVLPFELGKASDSPLALVSRLGGKRVLLVDDKRPSSAALLTMLQSFHLHVEAVDSAEACLVLLDQIPPRKPFDLLMFDWMTPDLDGLELAKHIRGGIGPQAGAPIIMFSALAGEDVVKRAERIGVNLFLRTPVERAVLCDALLQLLGETPITLACEAPRASPPHSGALRGRILLVEDNPINQQVARELLEQWGLSVHVAEDGLLALEALEFITFDAVLMDVEMPRLDGLETVRRIRRNKALKHLPVIALTARALDGDRELCLSAGMNDYLVKPIDAKQLYHLLSQWVGSGLQGAAPLFAGEPFPTPEHGASPPIDEPEALGRLNGDRVLFLKILKEFLRSYAKGGAQLRSNAQEGDLGAAHRFAHTLKGVAGNIGAKPLAAAARAIELAFKHNTLDRLEPLLIALEQTLQEALDAASALLGEARPGTATPTSLNILLVEDSQLNRAIYKEILSKEGHRVQTASDGKEACLRLFGENSEAQAYDLILMDIEMPEMDGLKAAQTIRKVLKSSPTPPCRVDIPIIALTSHEPREEMARCLAAGMNDCVHKTFEKGELMDALAKAAAQKFATASKEQGSGTEAGVGLEKNLDSARQAALAQLDRNQLVQALEALEDCLDKGSLDADAALASLKAMLPNTLFAAEFDRLEESVDAFEYRIGLSLVQALARKLGTPLRPQE